MRESRRYPGLIVKSRAYCREAMRRFRQRQRQRIGVEEQRRLWRERMRAMRTKDRRPMSFELARRIDSSLAAVRA